MPAFLETNGAVTNKHITRVKASKVSAFASMTMGEMSSDKESPDNCAHGALAHTVSSGSCVFQYSDSDSTPNHHNAGES